MEWTKIKNKYFLYSDMSLNEHGALSRLLCLTAHLEQLPTRRQMLKVVSERCLNSMSAKLRIPIAQVLERVLEDVSSIHCKRSVSRQTSQKHRDSVDSDTSRELSNDATEKIREDKIREEKTKHKGFIDDVVKKWNEFSAQYPAIKAIRSVTPERRKHLKRRFENKDFVKSFDDVLAKIPVSDFLMGRIKSDAWRVDFDFLIRNDENYQKILEGKYGEQKFKSELDKYAS